MSGSMIVPLLEGVENLFGQADPARLHHRLGLFGHKEGAKLILANPAYSRSGWQRRHPGA